MEQGTSKSEYSSLFTPSAETTTLASDVENFDVMLCFHCNSNLKDPVLEAIRILNEKEISAKSSIDATITAGKLKQDCIMQFTKRSKYRVYLINKAFVKHELAHHGPILYNAKLSTSENTILMARPIHQKKIPDGVKHLPMENLPNRINAEYIAEKIIEFIKENKTMTSLQSNLEFIVAEPVEPNEHKIQEFEAKKQLFREMVDGFETKRAFVLCTCIKPTFPFACKLSLMPWLKVFDFDSDSENDGLLSVAKGNLQSGKFSVTCASEEPVKSSDMKTDWTIVKTEASITPETLSKHISSLSYFCAGQKPATMLIVWYHKSDDDLEDCLRDLITNINHDFKPPRRIKFVLCLSDVPDESTEFGRISKKYANDNRVIAPLEKICEWIQEIAANRIKDMKVTRLTLPRLKDEDDNSTTFTLKDDEMNWLLTDMHVLTFNEHETITQPDNEKVARHADDYLKGGDLTWDVIEDGSFDVRRDIQQSIIECLDYQYIKAGKSGIVTLFHSPGSGGSTVGRRVLWEFREHIPCMALPSKTEVQDDFRDKIKTVRDRSNLPILLLIDGRSGQEVRNILDLCRYERLVILHVLRYYSLTQKHPKTAFFFLPDYISENEAQKFEKLLVKHGNAGIRKKLANLTKDVGQKVRHSVFEYGLTAFHSEFRGVKKYVESHLLLEKGLQPWHKVAAFLSLANYYGNCAVPSELFSIILEKQPYVSVDLQMDIPELGQQFIRECADISEWKISHYIVAQEILKQYKSKTKIELDALSIDFLHCTRSHLVDPRNIPHPILRILNNIFIIRHSEGAYENDDYKTKPTYSRLIMDVGDQQKQKCVFKTLIEEFPQNAEFYAHYGRFLGKSNQHNEAIDALKKAVRIREQAIEIAGKNTSDSGDEVLYRIHSMFGYAYNAHVRHIFGNHSVGFMIAAEYSQLSPDDLHSVHNAVLCAIQQFQKCRSYYCPSVSPSYGFVGEIQIRLYLAEFCKKITKHNMRGLCDRNHRFHFLWDMICDSFIECDFLLDECIKAMNGMGVVQNEISRFLNLFNDYFIISIGDFEKWISDDGTMSSKRYKLTLMKIKRKTDKKREFRIYQDLIPNSYEVDEFLQSLEDIFEHSEYRRIKVSLYMEDWLKAIRLSKKVKSYNFHRIMHYVDKWDQKQERESLSTLYNYILHFLRAIQTHIPVDILSLNRIHQQLENRHKMLPQWKLERPVEWLTVFLKNDNSPLEMLRHHYQQKDFPLEIRQFFRGHVVDVRGWSGFIELHSMGSMKIRVFFAPNKFNIKVFHAKERWPVEFIIGFNPKHGAQAYKIAFLHRKQCIRCNVKFETSELSKRSCPTCGFAN
ncbi:uncharacterized protein LOC120326828 [Styela clava]